MPVEVAKLVDDFNKLWPRGTDPVSKADDHIRMIKEVLQLEFGLLYNKTRIFSFEAGAVVNPDCILYYEAEKAFYQWNGTYDVNNEYVVNAGSTPETAGGIGGNAWTRSTGSGFMSTVLVSDTEPTAPFQNMLWWDTNSGTFFIYYNDGTSTQWVDLFGIADQASFNTLLFRSVLARLAAESGYTLVSGSFQEGAVSSGSSDVVLDWNTAKFYQWHLNENKEVPAGSTPATAGGIGAGAWVDKTDLMLRSELLYKTGLTTVDLINSSGLSIKTNEIIQTTGFNVPGIGSAKWRATTATGIASKSPVDLGELKLTNADGIVFELVHDGVVTFEQIGSQGTMVQGSKPDHDSWDAFYLAFKISKAAIESIEESQKIKFVATACTYYISKPLLLTNQTTYESNHVLGAFVYYGNQTLSASEISDVIQPGAPSNLDIYTGVTAHVMFWHVDGNYTRYARLVGFDFATAHNQIATYGVFMPHANYCEIERCRFVNVQYGRYTRDTYFCAFKHLTYNAGAAQGVYGEYILPRIVNGSNDNIGSGTSNTYENIGYNNFYASINSKNHLYSTFTNCYTEGALSQHAIKSKGDKLTFNSYGIENMGSGAVLGDDGRILTASGGSELTINGIQAVYNVTIMKPEAIAVTGEHAITGKPTKVILNNPDMSGVLNNCVPFYSDNTALLSVTYPTLNGVITNWWIGLGKKSTYINPHGCLVLNSEYDSALVTFKNGSTFTYMFSDGTNMRIKYGTMPTSAKDGILIGGIETTTSANLASATDVINTTAKYAGKEVYNLTTFKPLWAGGSSATATWGDATGAVVITPT